MKYYVCRDSSLGLMTKIRACEGARQEWSLKVTFHAFKNVGKCEGMNLHTPKWVLTLKVGIFMDFQIFRKQLQELKLIELKSYLYHWKALKT
jgi:hypothetical protein